MYIFIYLFTFSWLWLLIAKLTKRYKLKNTYQKIKYFAYILTIISKTILYILNNLISILKIILKINYVTLKKNNYKI